MFEFITIARILFSVVFSLTFLYVSQFITEVGKKKCPLSSSLYISNGKLFGGILIMIGLINIILPINKFIYNIPVIGTSYVFIIMLLIFVMFFVLKRIISNLQEDENKKCRTKNYKPLRDFIENRSIAECIYITVAISIVFFYL